MRLLRCVRDTRFRHCMGRRRRHPDRGAHHKASRSAHVAKTSETRSARRPFAGSRTNAKEMPEEIRHREGRARPCRTRGVWPDLAQGRQRQVAARIDRMPPANRPQRATGTGENSLARTEAPTRFEERSRLPTRAVRASVEAAVGRSVRSGEVDEGRAVHVAPDHLVEARPKPARWRTRPPADTSLSPQARGTPPARSCPPRRAGRRQPSRSRITRKRVAASLPAHAGQKAPPAREDGQAARDILREIPSRSDTSRNATLSSGPVCTRHTISLSA